MIRTIRRSSLLSGLCGATVAVSERCPREPCPDPGRGHHGLGRTVDQERPAKPGVFRVFFHRFTLSGEHGLIHRAGSAGQNSHRPGSCPRPRAPRRRRARARPLRRGSAARPAGRSPGRAAGPAAWTRPVSARSFLHMGEDAVDHDNDQDRDTELGMPAINARAAATHSISAKKWVNSAANRRQRGTGWTCGNIFGPSRASSWRASAVLSGNGGHGCTVLRHRRSPVRWLTEPVLCAGTSALSALRIVARSTSSWNRAPATAGI